MPALSPWSRFAVLALVSVSLSCHAAFDAFLKIEGVDGESRDSKHSGWIDVSSFSHGLSRPAQSTSAPGFLPLCVAKLLDKASPVLAQRCASGATIPSAELQLVTAADGRVKFYQVTLSNVVVRGITTAGQSPDVGPAETLCLGFNRIEWVYTEFDAAGLPNGDVAAWWDLVLNTGAGSAIPVLRLVGTPVAGGQFRLSWTARAGRTYSIRSSPEAAGPFGIVGRVSAPTDGPLTYDLPATAGAGFFNLEEAP